MYKIVQFLFAFFVLSSFVNAQTPPYAPIQGFCATGGQPVKVSGMNSTNTVLASYPKCLVNVYLTGTLTPATIYKDSTGTPLGNPFIANADASWLFYVANTGGQAYDITMTGGVPVAFPQPFTLISVFPNNPGTSGGGGGVDPSLVPLPCTYYAAAGSTVSPNPQCKVDAAGNLTTPTVNRTYFVDGYGATGTGTICPNNATTCIYAGTNDTAPIQTAINAACSAGGGTILFAGGKIYNIVLPTTAPRINSGVPVGLGGLYIPCSNIDLTSSGPGRATLSFWMNHSGTIERVSDECVLNPDSTSPPQSPPIYRVFRGSGIFLNGSTDPNNPQNHVSIHGLRITGNAYINGNNKNPIWYDNQFPTVKQSICNAWDTSNKGIFFNNGIWTFASFDQSSGYYSAGNYYYDDIRIYDNEIDHFMGELIYAGNQIPHITVSGNTLHDSNGDAESIGGGVTSQNNEMYNLSANGVEDTPGPYAMTYKLNRLHDIALDGISIVNLYQAQFQNPTYGNQLITNNDFDHVARNGISLFNGVNASVLSNHIKDAGWRFNNFASGILLYNFGNTHAAAWAPAAPAAPTVSAGASGGSLTGGTYLTGVAWAFNQSAAVGLTAISTTTTTTSVAANGTLTVTEPSSPPANAVGWFPFICNGGSCTLKLQNNSSMLPLATTSYVQFTEPVTSSFTAPNSGIVVDPNATGIKISDNNCIADTGSTYNCFTLTSNGPPLIAPYISSTSITNNLFSNPLHNPYAPVAAPASAPSVSAVTAPGFATLPAGTYYVRTQFVSPACVSNRSAESTVTIGSGQMIRVQPPTTTDSSVIGYLIGVGTVSGTEYVQYVNNWQKLTLPYDQSIALVTTTPMTDSNCVGVTLSHGLQFNLFPTTGSTPQATAFVENGNQVNNSLVQNTNQNFVNDYLLTSTSAYVGLVQQRPWRPRNYKISYTFTVVNAATTVTGSMTWIDSNGVSRSQSLANDTYGTGTQSFPDISISANSADKISLNFQAGTANNVYVTAAIKEN